MAQMAQQSPKFIDGQFMGVELSDEQKKQLRRAIIRGTINDCVLRDGRFGGENSSKILSYSYSEGDAGIVVSYYDYTEGVIVDAQCGKFQPDDYTDDTPTDEE